MTTRRLVTLGETMASMVPPQSGSLRHARELLIHTGGAESNVAVGFFRLGGAATWIGRVGDDGLGLRVQADLRAEGLDVRVRVDPDAATGLMVKERPLPGRTRVRYYRAGSAGSRLCPEDIPVSAIDENSIVHVTGITPGLSDSAAAAVERALDRAEEVGALVSFDVNHRDGVWRSRDASPIYRDIAARATVVFTGRDEARLLAGPVDERALLEAITRLGPTQVVLKLGAAGAMALIDGVFHQCAAVPVDVVDSVGAGDAFVAGYLSELAAGHPAAKRLETGTRAGAFACQGHGDWESAPRRDELALLLAPEAEPVVR